MKTMRLHGKNLLLYGVTHWSYDRFADPQRFFLEDLYHSGFSIELLQNKRVVLDFLSEGQDAYLIKPLLQCLRGHGVIDIAVMFNAITNVLELEYPALCLPAWLSNQGGFLNQLQQIPYEPDIDVKFLCLMRTPTESRARIAKFLNNIESARFSYASSCQPTDTILIDYRDLVAPLQIPKYLDGLVTAGVKESNLTDKIFRSSFFNLVAETSSQHENFRWHSQFITEKTFKAFALRQVPIWFATPGLVKEIRNLGFDMFDDIVDHSYDDLYDQTQRYDHNFAMIKSFDQKPLEYYQQLRLDLSDRLEKNAKLVSMLHTQQSRLLNNFLERINA
jgi:hypothetical protein